MKIQFTPVAKEDLDQILAYVCQHSPAGARNVGHALWRTVTMLGSSPMMGRPGVIPGTREVLVGGYPYILAYRVDHDAGELSILSIVHMARRRP